MATYSFAQYGLIPYGVYQYGIYELYMGEDSIIQPESRMRIRFRTADNGIGVWVESQRLQQAIPGYLPRIRLRNNLSTWLYLQSVFLSSHATKVRVRARNQDQPYDWVLYEEAILQKGEGS